MLFETTSVMAVDAPDCGKDLEEYEALISSVTNALREGRGGGARELYITWDLNVELELMCTDEEDIEELNEVHGLLCWQGYENDHGGCKKLMWYGIMKEFNCKATSTWFKCGREKKRPSRTGNLVKKRQEWKAQMDCITGAWEEVRRSLHLQ